MSSPATAQKLKEFYSRVSVWKQLYYKWRGLKGVPLRKKFFVGYDLDANTYWEYFQDGKHLRPRRMVEPYEPQKLIFNYFDKVPIQWAQWLKFSRKTPPSIFDILQDEERVRKLQIMSQFKEGEQLYNKELHQQRIEENLNRELGKIQNKNDRENQSTAENAAIAMQKSGYDLNNLSHLEIKSKSNAKLETDASSLAEDPWKQAAQSNDQPQEATFKPRR